MPRAYTEEEARTIHRALMDSGRARFEERGLRKVTVQELTQAVGIGKGSFYLFFESKESLFFAIQEEQEALFKQGLEDALRPVEHDAMALIERFIMYQLEALDAHPFLRQLVEPGVLARLMEKLPPDVQAAHQEADHAYYLALIQRWIDRGVLPPHTDPELIFTVITASFALAVSRELVGERWDEATRLMARGLARELTARG